MRIYVKISDKMGDKLDYYANEFGMSKSAFVAYAVGKHIKQLDYEAQAYKVVRDKLSNIMDVQSKEGTFNEDLFINDPNEKQPTLTIGLFF